jgi:hypothetical protein
MNQTPTVPRHQRPSLTERLAAVPDTRLPDPDPDDVGEGPDRSRRWLALLALVALVAIVCVYILSSGGKTATEQRDAAVGQSVDLATQVQQACASGQLSPTDRLCAKAAEVRADPIPAERGPGPTPEEIRSAVADYLIAHPPADGRAPTTAEIAAAVSDYLTRNPPDPGRPPTAAEIADAVVVYFAANPVRDGAPGRPPTADEIRAAVDAHLAENPPPAGRQGVQGIGVSDVRAEQRDGHCALVFTLTDPASSTTAEKVVAVPDGVCADSLLGP